MGVTPKGLQHSPGLRWRAPFFAGAAYPSPGHELGTLVPHDGGRGCGVHRSPAFRARAAGVPQADSMRGIAMTGIDIGRPALGVLGCLRDHNIEQLSAITAMDRPRHRTKADLPAAAIGDDVAAATTGMTM